MDKKELIIGLDVGSDSVGWAVTDEDFNLRRIKGKTAWGARIFDSAFDAKTRRSKRTARRRNQRRKYRIVLLNSLFDKMISQKDPTFFLRLENSNYVHDDKDEKVKNQYPLFIDLEKEKAFYKTYPTIWHLRKELVENSQSEAFNDIRNVYLAIHHIIKYRGNFLSTGNIETAKFDVSFIDDANNYFQNLLNDKLGEESNSYIFIEEKNIDEFAKILDNREFNIRDKKANLKKIINKCDDEIEPFVEMFVTLVCGGSFNLSKVVEGDEKLEIKFDNSFDEKAEQAANMLGEDYALVFYAKRIFDYFKLKDLLRGENSISNAFVKVYETHKSDLKFLKFDVCKKIDQKYNLIGNDSLYFKIFKDKDNEENYAAFVRVDSNKSNVDIHKFNSFLLKTLEPYFDDFEGDEKFQELRNRCGRDEYLQTIAVCSTSVIPHQLHEIELQKILDNAERYYPELADIKDKILQIFLFRVPYYFGPLDDRSEFSNVVRKGNEKVLPWNINEIIDDDKTRANFMNNLTNSCTYLIGEREVLPLQSITYQKFVILNRLNTLRINGVQIEQSLKLDLYDFILNKKNTTQKQISNYLKKKYDVYAKDGVSISGINENDSFVSDSYCFFKEFYGVNSLSRDQLLEADEIINILAIYSDNNNDAVNYIKKTIVKNISKTQEKMLLSKAAKGWGKLSKKLLTNLKTTDESGVVYSIMDLLEQTTFNFQQIINLPQYGFQKLISEENEKTIGEQSKEDVVESILSSTPPKMRRSVIQAVRIVDEITKLTNQEPKYISIEVTREEDKFKKGKQTTSRQKEISDFINSLLKDSNELIKKQAEQLKDDFNELEQKEKLNSKHLYLYFKQDGLDLYTGKPIDINDILSGGQKYDTDHIIPKHLIKDDSLDNLVLVERVHNQKIKGGTYPIPEQIRCNPEISNLWKILYRKKAISSKKYNNLIRASEITDSELNDFVNAQINVVNHSNITIKQILEVKYPNTKLIFSKAQYPSYLRKELIIPKMRDLNDTHHAVDAYLNIVAGVTLHKEYSREYLSKKNDNDFTYNMENRLMFVLNKKDLVNKIQLNCQRTDILLTYRLQYPDDAFYGETIYKKGGSSLIPIHTNGAMANTDKYGGYSGLLASYFVIAKITKEKQCRKVLISVPILWSQLYKKPKDLENAIINTIKLKDGESITIDFNHKIHHNQKLLINGLTYLIVNSNADLVKLKPITPIFLDKDYMRYLNGALKYQKDYKDYQGDSFRIVLNRSGDDIFEISKEKNIEILNQLISIANKPKYNYCPMIAALRDCAEALDGKTLYEQIDFISSTILLFTRKSDLAKKNLRKSKTILFNDKIYAIYDSITGLVSYKKEL